MSLSDQTRITVSRMRYPIEIFSGVADAAGFLARHDTLPGDGEFVRGLTEVMANVVREVERGGDARQSWQ